MDEAAVDLVAYREPEEELLDDVQAPRQSRRWCRGVSLVGVLVVVMVVMGIRERRKSGDQELSREESTPQQPLALGGNSPIALWSNRLIHTVDCDVGVCACGWATGGAYGWCSSSMCPHTFGCPAPSEECWTCCCSALYPADYARATNQEFDPPYTPWEIFCTAIVIISILSICAVSCYVIGSYWKQNVPELLPSRE